MEKWEIDLREKLEKEVPEGAYNIGSGWKLWTGKKGFINFLVGLEFDIRLMGAIEIDETNNQNPPDRMEKIHKIKQ